MAYPGPPRGLCGPRAKIESGAPKYGSREGGLGAHLQEIMRFANCVLGAPEALFRTCTE